MSYYLRVSLTDRCQLRCTYCLPENAKFLPNRASSEEMIALMQAVKEAVGIHKIRLTGGEPTLNPDLPRMVAAARELVPIVGMTSNGLLLADQLPDCVAAGLNRINISLDGVTPEAFKASTRRDGLEHVLEAIRTAKELGLNPVKINCVATQQTDVAAMINFATFSGLHLRFIELMAIGEAMPWQAEHYISATEMREQAAKNGIILQESQHLDEPTSRVYSVSGHDPFESSVGFITTTSQPFCATCDRLRLSSQGKLYTCLMDDVGVDLLALLRANDHDALLSCIRTTVAGKRPPESFTRATVMAEIGG